MYAGDATLCVETLGWRPEGRVSDALLYFQPFTHSGIRNCEYDRAECLTPSGIIYCQFKPIILSASRNYDIVVL